MKLMLALLAMMALAFAAPLTGVFMTQPYYNQSTDCIVGSDVDSSNASYEWYVNFYLVNSGTHDVTGTGNATVSTLTPGNYTYGDLILCQAYLYNATNVTRNMSSGALMVHGQTNTIPIPTLGAMALNLVHSYGSLIFGIIAMAFGYLSTRQISSALFVASVLSVSVFFLGLGSLSLGIAIIYLILGVIVRFSGN